jgi:hypothetical protein
MLDEKWTGTVVDHKEMRALELKQVVRVRLVFVVPDRS